MPPPGRLYCIILFHYIYGVCWASHSEVEVRITADLVALLRKNRGPPPPRARDGLCDDESWHSQTTLQKCMVAL